MSIKSSQIPIDRKSEADSPLDIEDVTASSHRTSAKQSEKRSTLASPIVEKWGQPFDPLHCKKKAWMPRHVGQGFPDRSLRSCCFSKDARNPLSTLFFLFLLFVCLLICYFLFFLHVLPPARNGQLRRGQWAPPFFTTLSVGLGCRCFCFLISFSFFFITFRRICPFGHLVLCIARCASV